ncbi:MAG: alpha/beta fold hydrolase, partial [Gemmatimonadaceae bacterium]
MKPTSRHVRVSRSARVQTLGDVEQASDVWMVLHGFGQLAAEFIAPFAALAGDGCAVIAPEALNRFYKQKDGADSNASRPVGATWMTREDRDAEIADYVGYLDEVARQLVPGRAVTALGFSQGVATLMRWVTAGSTPLARVIVWAGEIPREVELGNFRPRFPDRPLDLVIGS